MEGDGNPLVEVDWGCPLLSESSSLLEGVFPLGIGLVNISLSTLGSQQEHQSHFGAPMWFLSTPNPVF